MKSRHSFSELAHRARIDLAVRIVRDPDSHADLVEEAERELMLVNADPASVLAATERFLGAIDTQTLRELQTVLIKIVRPAWFDGLAREPIALIPHAGDGDE